MGTDAAPARQKIKSIARKSRTYATCAAWNCVLRVNDGSALAVHHTTYATNGCRVLLELRRFYFQFLHYSLCICQEMLFAPFYEKLTNT